MMNFYELKYYHSIHTKLTKNTLYIIEHLFFHHFVK